MSILVAHYYYHYYYCSTNTRLLFNFPRRLCCFYSTNKNHKSFPTTQSSDQRNHIINCATPLSNGSPPPPLSGNCLSKIKPNIFLFDPTRPGFVILGLEDVMMGYVFGKRKATEVAHAYVSLHLFILIVFILFGPFESPFR